MKRDKETIHKTMSAIRGKNTGIERKLRKALTNHGIKYRLYSSAVIGHPDILLEGLKIAIFCDSEFWHGYHFEENQKQLESLDDYWLKKIRRNIARDNEVNATLKREGYTVLRFWGEEINKNLDGVVDTILKTIEKRKEIKRWKDAIKEFTTLTYIEKDGCYLLLHRNKEKNDLNEGKWIGVGGHLEEGENYHVAMKREVFEETGLTVKKFLYYGILDFLNDQYPPERMYLYKVTDFEGEVRECDEGELSWVPVSKVMDLPMWEGDRAFLPLLEKNPEGLLRMNLIYRGGELAEVEGPFYAAKPLKKGKKKHGRK